MGLSGFPCDLTERFDSSPGTARCSMVSVGWWTAATVATATTTGLLQVMCLCLSPRTCPSGWSSAGRCGACSRSVDVTRGRLNLGRPGPVGAQVEPVLVTTRVELHQGEPFARLHLSWENRSSDHR